MPEGSRLVLCTDGLVADRDRDMGRGLEQLRAALANGPDRDPEAPWPRSELITNAIRYGTQPVRVRMLHDPDRNLICEVSDGRSTSPHMRRAATTDEGGRGLFPVARFAERWGTRYLPRR